ncbi:poly(A) polymerase [Cognatiyoonia koreensis]|uniref:Poly(A) polymerase n=1 Tax=Cognatiyoonia koreensis TaxID=364200 RepID=A0A1I0RNQ9_9RHOB|nr:CCA tRNA nucleotidyltransferase [Cognatiyoonia koreensis]SEW42886.1 poly(A) polymerase [Cognatiyoonia koreensis]
MKQIFAPWVEQAAPICAMLTEAGFQAWFVGGCVRNTLLGAPVTDIDISTSARPDTVTDLAEASGFKAVPTGIDHGTVTVVADGTAYEVTTLRKDVATDGRRAVVAYADTLEEDALRRDFTMNAIYAQPDGVLVDPLDGLSDLKVRRFRFIEDADQRIKEDYLRILRFFRFHAWYGADGLDEEGLAACAANVDGIDLLSKERIGSELLKLLAAPNPALATASMASIGALLRILPGADHQPLAVLVHLEEILGLPIDPIRRLAVIGGEDAQNNLRLSKEQARRLAVLCQTVSNMMDYAYRHGSEVGIDRLVIEAAAGGIGVSEDDIATVRHAGKQRFPVKAADLMDRYKGPALGKALKDAEQRWIASGFTLGKDDLLA